MKRLLQTFLLSFIAFFGFNINAIAQNSLSFKQLANQKVTCAGIVDLVNVTSSYKPLLLSNEIDDRAGDHQPAPFIKQDHPSPFFHEDINVGQSQFKSSTSNLPAVVRQFDGANGYPDRPPDNTLAVSKAGYIVSALNSNYRIFNPNDNTPSSNIAFFDALKNTFPNITGVYYDPRVMYDAENDRFMIVLLNGNSTVASESYIVALFSKSGNPADGWYAYSLKGDIFSEGSFSDYPNIGISKSDLFISVNLFKDTLFNGPAILQVNKANGFSGNTLNFISYGANNSLTKRLNTLIPASHGLGKDYGDSMYFVFNVDHGDDSIRWISIFGSETSGKSAVKIYAPIISPTLTYASPRKVNEKQTNTTFTLNPDDARIEYAFYLNNIIHYVFSSRDQLTSNADIVYVRFNLTTKTATYAEVGLSGFDYVYPSLASVGLNDTDQSVMIGYCKSGVSIYPEVDAISCDQNMKFSSSITITPGTTPITYPGQTSGELRYGDYTGLSRQFGTNNCYFAGSCGSGNTYETTIAQLSLTKYTGIAESENPIKGEVNIFPNPGIDLFNINFNLEQQSHINISILDMQGKLIQLLYDGVPPIGPQRFLFNKAALPAGIYSLIIKSENTETITRKIVVE